MASSITLATLQDQKMEFTSPRDTDSHHTSKKFYFPFICLFNFPYEKILIFPFLIMKLSNQLNSLSEFSSLLLVESKVDGIESKREWSNFVIKVNFRSLLLPLKTDWEV